MQNIPYYFHYLRRHRTQQVLQKFLHDLGAEDMGAYTRQLGDYLYEFKIRDRYSEWTVLKTFAEIEVFMGEKESGRNSWRLGLFGRKAARIGDFNDAEFELKELRIDKPGQLIPKFMVKFFEIYNHNIYKITSVRMQKKVRGLTLVKKISNWCCGADWEPRRIIVTQEGIIEMAEDGAVTDFLKFDLYFSVVSGVRATGNELGVSLFSAHRKLVLKAFTFKDFINFLFYTTSVMETQKSGINYMGSCKPSLANKIEYLVDAKNYYRQVAKQIDKAQRDIFICGWWISPELYLVRPVSKENQQFRLDRLLKKKADQGVKIYIIVFLSPPLIPNDSEYTKRALANLSANITVQRHPHEVLPKLWSHHEKAVIVDQKVALMGGLDLCYGRFDCSSHPINANDKGMYPGIDYNNVRIKDFLEVRKFEADLQDRNLPRLPWHDVAYKVTGKMVADVANHFIQYWNFTLLEKNIAPIVFKSKEGSETAAGPTSRENLQAENTSNLVETIFKMAIQNNVALREKEKNQMQEFITNKSKKQKFAKIARTQWLKNKLQLSNGAGKNSLVLSIESLGLIKIDQNTRNENKKIYSDQLQLLRSASQWSIGLEQGVTERSIQNAYLSMIKNAKSFIYIENQFFISATGEKESYVQNQIANALYERIKKAHDKGEKFRVVIFMPLLPGMEGELSDNCPLSLKLTMFWQYNTLMTCQQSLIPRVARLTPNYRDYIEIYSLRNHGILGEQPVTEIIYIHTKLMIVDDNVVLCGSANINDRSQAGDRDSELAVVLSEGEKAERRMNGVKEKINRKAHELRMNLYCEHFGMSEAEAEDPLNDKTIALMRNISQTNTKVYRELFGCCPDDNVKKLAEVKDFEKIPDIQEYQRRFKEFRGHAVQFPTLFLSDEKLYKFDLNMVQDIFT